MAEPCNDVGKGVSCCSCCVGKALVTAHGGGTDLWVTETDYMVSRYAL